MSSPRGRGTSANPRGRFERLDIEWEVEGPDRVETVFLRDTSRSILSSNDSPDVFFDRSINPYRGCEHGCAYCYARPTHEYLGFSAGLDFETRILVKENAAELLRKELLKSSYEPTTLALSGVTDPYQPIERRLGITRSCLEVIAELRNPVQIVTKNQLVERDRDLLGELAKHDASMVLLSITTLDPSLARILEPRCSSPRNRLAAIESLTRAGVPTGVLVAPIIPAINDHEIPAILEAAAGAGATMASFVALRLPFGLRELFDAWLQEHFPDRKERVLSHIRGMRGGELNATRFGERMRGRGAYAEQFKQLFDLSCRRHGLNRERLKLSTAAFRRPGEQLGLEL